jgi:exopolysaccharide biosynthesis predicted pyruvyltransferase EpsI
LQFPPAQTPPAEASRFGALRQVILRQRHRPIVFVPNPGNAGDSLIAEATYQFLDGLDIAYRTSPVGLDVPEGACVLLGGGGNLVEPYPNLAGFLRQQEARIGHLVILPHSVRSYADAIRPYQGRAAIFCREEGSMAYCQAELPEMDLYLADDMAFGWSRKATDEASRLAAPELKSSFSLLKRETKLQFRRRTLASRKPVLDAFRTDVEGTGKDIPEGNLDLSSLFATDSMERAYAARAVKHLADFLARFEAVRTDRLHIAILGAHLGLDVEMHDNSYGKNDAVYRYSMAGRFPNVRFIPKEAASEG